MTSSGLKYSLKNVPIYIMYKWTCPETGTYMVWTWYWHPDYVYIEENEIMEVDHVVNMKDVPDNWQI